MATIVTINGSDLPSNSRADLNTNFANLNSDKIETSTLDTDTSLAANSDSRIATQKAVKTYVDTGGNVNASETNKGIVEEATDAEVTAGTATGGTGAKLFVTPAKLATRLSSVIFVDKVATAGAQASVTNTTDETNIISTTIAGGSLSTNNAIRAKVYISAFSTDGATMTIRAKYGATTMASLAFPNSSDATSNGAGFIEFILLANAATNAQRGALIVDFSRNNLTPNTSQVLYARGYNTGTATEDSTADKTLAITVQFSATAGSESITYDGYTIEKIA